MASSSLGGIDRDKYHKVIVGVDYGTTFTGVSYVDSLKNTVDDINVIRNWPGPSRISDENWKTPSRIAYSATGQANPTIEAWGYTVRPSMQSYTWTKLLLDQDGKIANGSTQPDMIEGNGLMTIPNFKSNATEVCADFLREIYKYAMEQFNHRFNAEIMEYTTLEFWFTVPAIWSDKAKDETVKAARAAGFGTRNQDTIYMISEPEAGAIAALSNMAEQKRLKSGEGVLVCDCGGGTVDIITYKLLELEPTIQFEEILVSTGDKCGSTYIDREFYKWMSKTFGSAFDKMKPEKKKQGSTLMNGFEMAKRDFNYPPIPGEKFEFDVTIPGAEDSDVYDTDESMLKIPSEVMESLFKPVIAKIQNLLEDQLMQIKQRCQVPIKTIVLIGGFGDSRYLSNYLGKWCKSQGQISLVCPANAQASVVKGAALRGLKGLKAKKRIARLHYGVPVSEIFREGIDPEESSHISGWNELKYCGNRMNWLITKGIAITPENCEAIEVNQIHSKGDDLSWTQDIYTCADETPPEWLDLGTCKHVGDIHYSFSKSDLDRFEKRTRVFHKSVYRLPIRIAVNAKEESGLLEFQVEEMNGSKLGRANIEYA